MGKAKNRRLRKIGMILMAAAVLFTADPGDGANGNVYAASDPAPEGKSGAPDTSGLFYSSTICVYDNTVYAIEGNSLTQKTVEEDDSVHTTVLAEDMEGAECLNITEEAFYAVTGSEIVRIGRADYERTSVYRSENAIALFILSPAGDFYTLENGEVYKNGQKDFAFETAIDLFCPIDGGYLFSTGSVLDHKVYLYHPQTGISFVSDAELWYVEADTLVLNRTDGDFMISIEDLLKKGNLKTFDLYGGGYIADILADTDGDTSGIYEPLTPAEESVNTAALVRRALSQGQKNCQLRARQMAEVEWTCQSDIPIFQLESTANKEYFKAGVTYYGIPYGQPIYHGGYVGPFSNDGTSITIDKFKTLAADPSSVFYTSHADYNNRIMPTYSSDCSAFVSYCWGSDTRFTTSDFKTLGDRGTKYANVGTSVSQLVTGYSLNKGGSHTILIYDVAYDQKGNIAHVTTVEQTPPIIRKRSWGAGGNYGSLADLQAKITSGYMILKNLSIDSVGYTEASSIPLDQADYTNRISSPVSSRANGAAASGTGTVLKSSQTFAIEGWSSHKDGAAFFEYKIDSGAWTPLAKLKKGDLYTFYADAQTPAAGDHTVAVRGKTNQGAYYTVAEFKISVVSSKPAYTTYLDRMHTSANVSANNAPYRTSFTFANAGAAKFPFAGWSVNNAGVIQYEYKVDDGLWLPVETYYRQDVYNSGGIAKNCPAFNSFTGGFDFSSFTNNTSHKLYMRGVTDTNDVYDIAEVSFVIGSASGAVPAVNSLELKTLPSVLEYNVGDPLDTEGLFALATYADGSVKAVYSGFTYDYDFSTPGEKTVTVSYAGKTAFYTVQVSSAFTYGDLNGDGKINGADSTLLQQYLAEWTVTVNQAAADVNGDGTINGADSTLLQQYLAEWDVTIGKK